jgi:hypothetical protein
MSSKLHAAIKALAHSRMESVNQMCVSMLEAVCMRDPTAKEILTNLGNSPNLSPAALSHTWDFNTTPSRPDEPCCGQNTEM